MRFRLVALMLALPALAFSLLVLIGCRGVPDAPSPELSDLPILEEVGRIGCLDCEGPKMLTVIYLTMDADGTIYVLDRYEPFVRLFDHQGEILRAFGEAGQGPGELGVDLQFEYLPGIAIYPWSEGSTLVHEALPQVLTAFDQAGVFSGELILDVSQRVPRNTAWDAARERLFMQSFIPGEGPRVDRFDFAGQTSAAATTILTLAEAFPLLVDDPTRPPTGPFSMALTADGEIALGDPWVYDIHVFAPSGDFQRLIHRDTERPRKNEVELSEERERLAELAARAGIEVEEPAPDKPHFGRGALDFDDAGRLWVGTYRGTEGETLFDLFSPAGDYLGEVNLPAELALSASSLRLYAVAGEHLAAVVADDSGNHGIGVWRVVWS